MATDLVWFRCPECSAHLSKYVANAGSVDGQFSPDRVPFGVAKVLDDSEIRCIKCETTWVLRGMHLVDAGFVEMQLKLRDPERGMLDVLRKLADVQTWIDGGGTWRPLDIAGLVCDVCEREGIELDGE